MVTKQDEHCFSYFVIPFQIGILSLSFKCNPQMNDLIMNTYAMIVAGILFFYGIYVISFTLKLWNLPGKTLKIRISELIYGAAFFGNGFIILNLFSPSEFDTASLDLLYSIIFWTYFGVLVFVWSNILFTFIRVKRYPELMADNAPLCRQFDKYFEKLNAEYKTDSKKDLTKDFSRKILHFIQFVTIIILHEMVPLQFRNAYLEAIGSIFMIMFASADAIRVVRIQYLPDWALKWYATSLEMKEKYTYNSALPFLLAMLLLIQAPIQVILSAGVVACIADAMASIIGKRYGKHKLSYIGRYPHKSFEGLLAGLSTSFIGIFLVFAFYPLPGVNILWVIIFGLIGTLSFAYNDIYSQYVVDNILNSIVPGAIIWFCIAFLI